MTKTVFITGGAMGIGACTARSLVKKGAKVALFDLNEDLLAELANEFGSSCITFKGDVCSMADLDAAMVKTQEKFGRIDAVFANAGIARITPLVSMSEAEWMKVIDINLNGVWRTLKAATPHLLTSKGYALVTSSASSTVCLPLATHYTSSKGAVLNLADAYRTEMRGLGIDVGTLHPMFIRTAMVEDAVWGTKNGKRLAQQSKILFLNFPLKWCASRASKMILRRQRRATVPISHLPVVWFPRAVNNLTNLIAFRKGSMRKLMLELAKDDLEGK